mgnify:CR=1 FL=1
MAIVYRIESRDGVGLYSTKSKNVYEDSLSTFLGLSNLYPDKLHPSPMWDKKMSNKWGILEDKEIYYFGCSSIKQLRNWLSDEQLRMIKNYDSSSHKIVIYDVDDEHFIDGKTQCAFIKEKAIWFGEVEPELIVDIRLIKPSRFNFIYNKRLKKIFTKYSEHCMIMHVLGQWPDNFEKWIRSYYV